MTPKEKLAKLLQKSLSTKSPAIARELVELEDKILNGVKGEKGEDGYTPIKGKDYFDGKDGEKGEKGDKGDTTIVEKVIEKTEVIRETPIVTNEVKEVAIHETPEEIRAKLESLKDEDRLDASAIKNLPEFVESKANGGGWRNLWQLHDTTIDTPTDGQVLTYDNITQTWKNENPTGTLDGSGTANEIAYWVDSDTLGTLAVATYPSLTELSYVKGVTSAIQTQLNGKQATLSLTTTGSSGASTLVGATLNIPNYTLAGLGGATTALDNLASVAINTALLPGTSDSIALGSTTKQWSDLFLGSGGIINFNAGDVLMTHSSNKLTLSGGSWDINNASGFTARNGASDGYSFTQANTNSWIFTPLTANSFITFASSHLGLTDYVNVYTNGTTATFQRTSDSTDLLTLNYSSGAMELLYSTFKAPTLISSGGTTSAPGMTFNGDTNTGFYGNGSGAWGLTNDGTTSIYANSSANVHIGGTSPLSGYKLTVTGNQYIDGALDADSIGYNSLRSVFGERKIAINEFADALWKATKRFTVTQSGAGTLANMFDGDYETNLTVPVSTTNVINVNVANQSGVPSTGFTYPEGHIYLHFYYTNHNYDSIQLRVQRNGVWTTLSAPTDISTDNVNKVLSWTLDGTNYLTDIELTVTTNGTDQVLITAMNYIMDRWTDQAEVPYFDKYATYNRVLSEVFFRTGSQTTGGAINPEGDWYMGVGGTGGKFGIGTSSLTHKLHVNGNALIESTNYQYFYDSNYGIRASNGLEFKTADLWRWLQGSTEKMRLDSNGDLGLGTTNPTNKIHTVADSATTSASLLRLSGGATNFSGTNDTGAYSIIFDGCAYDGGTGIIQVDGAKIELLKENSWNYASVPTGTLGSLVFYTSAGTPASPTLTEKMRIMSSGNVRIVSLDTDATAPTTSGTTKMVITDANGQLSFDDIPTSGSSTFIGLTDVPATFTGQANKYVRVNAGETALEFVTLAGGGDALTTDPLSQFAATTSLQLKGVISDETGSGALVFADTPTLIAPILGTPTSGTLTNCTGLPTTGISGVTASSAEINILDGATLTTTELNYVDGVTSAIQTQLDAKLALAGGTMTGNITLGENASIDLDPAGSADGKYTGIAITGTAGAALAFGDLIYLDPTDSRWELADANAASGADGDARGILGICVLAAAGDGSATKILLNGVVRADTAFPAFTVNNPIYVSETAGDVTQTQPTTTDVVIRILGSALTADEMYFNPDWAWATHT